MKLILQTLIPFFCIALFFTACEKEESPEVFDSISGVLSAGENMSAEDLVEITVYLAKIDEGINPETVSSQTQEIEFLQSTLLDASGRFTFDSIAAGNYVVALSEGFIIANDTFAVINFTQSEQLIINNTVNRVIEENRSKGYTIKLYNASDFYSWSTSFEIDSICFFVDGNIHKTITPDKITSDGKFLIELNRKDNTEFQLFCHSKTNKFSSNKLPFFEGCVNSDLFDNEGNAFFHDRNYDYYLTVMKWYWFGYRIKLKYS